MEIRRFLQILFTAAALALEIFTRAAVMVFVPEPGKHVRTMYAYFSPVPFGCGMFPPLITAILTVILLILGFAALKNKRAQIALCVLAPAAFIASLLSLLYGLRYYSLLAGCISLALLLGAVFAIAAPAGNKPTRTPAGKPPMPPSDR